MRSKSPELLYQELSGLLLAHDAVRARMHESALQADLDPDRLSLTHALHVLDTACYELAIVAAEELPRLRERLLADLREPKTLLPLRNRDERRQSVRGGSGSIKKDGSDPRKPLPPVEGKASSAWKTRTDPS